ncbi:MAG: protease complex subunit PrcB family protein [Thermoanaerobaculia bacterium]
MKFRTISEGSYSAVTPASAEAHLALDAAGYARLWDRLIGRGERREIDFEAEVAVFLLAGERNTGGYGIEMKGVSVEGETLVVDAAVTGPAPGMMVTQALTSPWEVVAVERRDVKSVRWGE